jgi:Leucine-rich repeat (LRR) protein
MEIALERIANMRDGVLNLSNLGLTELPQLVSEGKLSKLVELYCEGNQLTSLPQLPSTLVKLYCYGNQLTELPQLPSTLECLDCYGNQLTELPQLPSTLVKLYCGGNQLQYPPANVSKKSIAYIREWMSENPLTFVKSANKV